MGGNLICIKGVGSETCIFLVKFEVENTGLQNGLSSHT